MISAGRMRSAGLGFSIFRSRFLSTPSITTPPLFSFLRNTSMLATRLSWRSNILLNDLSLTAKSPLLVSYLLLTMILVRLVSQRGTPWISSMTMQPSPHTSMADVLLKFLTQGSMSSLWGFLFSQRMQLSSYGHMYSGVASLYCLRFQKTKLLPQSMSLNSHLGLCPSSLTFIRMFYVLMSECTILCTASKSRA